MILRYNYIVAVYTILYLCTCYGDKKMLSQTYCENKNAMGIKLNSFLWSVERPSFPTAYLFGTIHAPKDLVWKYIPSNTKDAFQESTNVFTEVDLHDANIIREIRKCRHLTGNLTLKDVLPLKLFTKLRATIKSFDAKRKRWISKFSSSMFDELSNTLPLYSQYKRLKPSWLMATILQQWNKFYVRSQFSDSVTLDSFLIQEAIKKQSYSGGIELVSSHCDPLNNLKSDHVNLALNITLHAEEQRMLGKYSNKENDIRFLVNLYSCGNPLETAKLGSLFKTFVDKNTKKQLDEVDKYLFKELVTKRNYQMADQMHKLFSSKIHQTSKMFFAIGAAHLLGNKSIVSILRGKGYIVRHVRSDEVIPPTQRRMEKEEKILKSWESKSNKSNFGLSHFPGKFDDTQKAPQVLIFKTEVKKTYVYYYKSESQKYQTATNCFIITLILTCLFSI